ncbi:MAG: chemotaxis protein CheB [Bacteroidia bacterium]|nr:chemotaxis protein CheB [Bacteroidia bacterium]
MLPVLNKFRYRIIAIGGSAGSFSIINAILQQLPTNYRLPILMGLHRLKDKREGFQEALMLKASMEVVEPYDKEIIRPGIAYLAPANYHLLVDFPGNCSLSTTELVQFSRPSIDVLFESVADVYGKDSLAILLSGANKDGAEGMATIKRRGGLTIVQDPSDCAMPTMPKAALQATEIDHVLKTAEIIELLKRLH